MKMKPGLHKKNVLKLGNVFLVLVFLTGCSTSIEQIKYNSDKYAGKDVFVSGEIESTFKIPFTDYSICTITDNTDSMLLFNSGSYAKGDKIRIKVKVIGISGQKSEESTKAMLKDMEDFLVENKLADKEKAGTFSKTILNVLSGITDSIEGSFFLMEYKNE